MSDKAAKKKQYILDTARGVFAKKGFKNVTMKDIVEACDISRGGLYIYFESTEAIFAELLNEEAEDIFSGSVSEDSSPAEILALFLNEQKKELLNNKNSLILAKYEYAFSEKEKNKADINFKDRYKSYVNALAALLSKGHKTGDFYCEDPFGAAHNILNAIEGLKVRSISIGITDEDIDKEFIYILSGLLNE